ncbi:Ig-like domain repeat protein [Emticicia sp. BO119]|uniref:Ig-like domain repeat protein n=1 Tax=Emticicia sp. BO119 TaxID=2757768 RepID=UPI0015F10118|nr:Ig-like domain repeat protein [Emticicia sp. BO119]MBA4851109.1 Ig-like domain repeat protein [Emticicia sp. BO119]
MRKLLFCFLLAIQFVYAQTSPKSKSVKKTAGNSAILPSETLKGLLSEKDTLVHPMIDFLGQTIATRSLTKVELFVMSQCPYGVQAEKEMLGFIEANKDKFDFRLHFIVHEDTHGQLKSLHGQNEVDEDFRQFAISRLYPEKLFAYLLQRAENYQENNWVSVATKTGINPSDIEEAMKKPDFKTLFLDNIRLSNDLGVSGSPTVYVNDEIFKGSILPLLTNANSLKENSIATSCTAGSVSRCNDNIACTRETCVNFTCTYTTFSCPGNACYNRFCNGVGCTSRAYDISETFSDCGTIMNINVSATVIILGESVTLSASCDNSNTVIWYDTLNYTDEKTRNITYVPGSGGIFPQNSSIGSGNTLIVSPTHNTRYYAFCSGPNGSYLKMDSTSAVTVNSTPVTPRDASNTSICYNSTATLTASCPLGTIGWYNASSSTLLSTASSFVTPALTTNTTYLVRCESGGENSDFISVLVSVEAFIAAPTVTSSTPVSVCSPTPIIMTASGCTGTVAWSTGNTGTSLTISEPGVYDNISAQCTVGSCTSASGYGPTREILAQPAPPSLTMISNKTVCYNQNLYVEASECAGTVRWYDNSTGSSLIKSGVGTYTFSANCTVGTCTSRDSVITGLEILPAPATPVITGPDVKVVAAPNTLTLTSSGCTGVLYWSTGATGSSLILSSAGNYTISARCYINNCYSPYSNTVSGLSITAPTTTTLSTESNPISLGTRATLTAMVSPATASGIVTFKEGTTVLGTASLLNGKAVFGIASFARGLHQITAFYEGDGSALPSTSNTITQVVNGLSAPKLSLLRQQDNLNRVSDAVIYGMSNLADFASDAQGNIYILGTINGLFTYRGISIEPFNSVYNIDMFIMKIDSTGKPLWAKRAGGSKSDYAKTIAIEGNSIYTVGSTSGSSTLNFNTPSAPGTNDLNITSSGTTYFMTKYDLDGNFKWARIINDNLYDVADISAYRNNVYISGTMRSNTTVDMNNSGGSPINITSVSYDAFVARYDSAGICKWARRGGGDYIDYGISIQATKGGVYFSGIFSQSAGVFNAKANFNTPYQTGVNELTSDNLNGNTFIGKYDPQGNLQWIKRGSSGSDRIDIAVSGASVFITGDMVSGNFNTPSSNASNTFTSVGLNDAFIARFDTLGNFQQSKRAGGASSDFADKIVIKGNKLYISGTFRESMNFDTPSAGAGNIIICEGDRNYFIAQYDTTLNFKWANRAGSTSATNSILGAAGSAVYWGTFASAIGTVFNFNSPYVAGSNELTGKSDLFFARFTDVITPTTTTLTINTNPANIGDAVQFTATVLPESVGGTVTFKDGTTVLGTAPLVGESATFSTNSLTQGTHTITAVFEAAGVYGASTSNTITQVINPDCTPPTINITGNTNLSCTNSTVTRTASIGSGTPTYLWSNGLGTNATATISLPGTYTVTVTVSGGCSATATTTVTRDATAPPASITGSTNLSCSTLSVTRTAAGGGTYQWSNGLGTNAIATITAPGTYTVTVTGSNGCTATATTTVTRDATAPPASITGSANLSCSTLSVTRTAAGGGTYQWSNGLGTNAIANISAPGTYTVTVTGANGCTATATTSVTQDGSLPSASISGSANLSCSTLSVTRTAAGGGTYQWSNGLGTNAIANISAPGTYTVTVTGANGCTATATTSVTQDGSLPNASITGSANLSCSTLSVTRTAAGGGTYQWSNGLGTNAIANISAPGTYTVTVTGSNGCTATATTTVTRDATAPPASITGSANLSCSTLSVTRTAAGGGTYQWSNGLGTNAIATISAPGTYTVTVTGSNGCTATATTSVTQDGSLPNASITGSANLSCSTLSVTRTAAGGGTYQWSNGLGTNAIATISAPGTYTVTVTGANGCTATATTSVTQDGSLPNASITGSTNLSCSTLSVTRTAAGGGTYQWSNGLGTNAIATITSPGTYTVTVTGSNGCTATATTSVTQDGSLPNASITGSANLSCSTLSVTRTAAGGGTYQWSNGLGTNAIATITEPGTYTVTVTGSNGCTATATTTVTRDATAPPASITGSTNLSCSTLSVTRTAAGGGTYQWSNGLGTNAIATISAPGTYTVTVTGANGCTATATTNVTQDGSLPNASITGSANLSCSTLSITRTAAGGGTYQWSNGLGTNAIANISAPGTYTVTVTGSNGCTATATTTVTRDATAPPASITGSANLSCSTLSVTRTAAGGGTYQWSNGLGTNAIATISAPGTYTVTVTGSNGCTATATTSVTQDGSLPNASITGSANLSCSTLSVTRTAAGGGTYQWSNGLGTNAIANISAPGTYTVTVTGANGCTTTATTTVTRDATAPPASITGSTNLSCSTLSITRTAAGGGTYQWSNGLGTNAIANISAPGTYTVTVTGSNGCTATATTTVTRDATAPPASITGSANLSCSTLSVTRTAAGGGTYQWSNGLGTNAIATISAPGTYTVTVTGSNGCTATATTSVTQDGSLPNASITGSTNLSCSTLSVTRTAAGGGTYQWSNGLGTNAIANISAPGTYTVTVTGANGCTATATTSVTQDGSLPNASITGSANLSCSTLSVTRTAAGGGTYQWSNGLGTNAIANISAPGTYTVTVTGSNGCTATATTTVTRDATAPPASITGSANLSCSTLSVTRTAAGGGTYQWSNGLGTNAIANISAPGTYTVTVTGSNGCTATATTSVTQDGSLPNASITGSTNLSCSTLSVTRTAAGGGTYQWSNGLGINAIANISAPGTYTVTVTGSNGCTATATTTVTRDATAPPASITGSANLSCSTLSVTRTAAGGGTYQWSNGLGTNAIANISAPGTYTVTVTGSNGCTATATTTVTRDATAPPASITGSANLSCSTLSVTRTAAGGGTYQWSNGLGTNAIANISAPGTYTVTVTGANGCTATATTTVTRDATAPPASITGSANLSCSTLSVTRTAAGGGTYQWSNGLGTNAIANISAPGTYTVTVTGANGCTATATTSVTQDGSLPNASITGSANLSCSTLSVTRTAAGGGTYQWSNGLGTNAIANISAPGTYTVTVTGANGCTATATTSVTQDGSLPNASITGSANLSCSTLSVTRTAAGGGTYQWSNGLGTNAIANISAPGTYTVTVTASGGCTATATTSVSLINDTQISISNTGPYNINQTIELFASGGTEYNWTGPAAFSSSTQNPAIPNALISNGGIYTVTIINGVCTATATTSVIINGIDPCAQIIDYQYVKSGNPYQPLFSLKDGMVIQQIPDQVSIMAVPICPSIQVGSVDMTIVGPDINWTILQNVEPFAIFDNLAANFNGRNLIPGTYTMTVTGYLEDNRIGGIVYGPVVTTFTVTGGVSTISTPQVSSDNLCAGSTINVNFSTTGAFFPDNTFRIELSDTLGRFINPLIIGINSSAGTVVCQLPGSLVVSDNYLIRVISSNQVIVSNPTISYLSVIPAIKNITTDFNSGVIREQSSLQINANNKVASDADVIYHAGKSIILIPGFTADSGAVFKAEIKSCPN